MPTHLLHSSRQRGAESELLVAYRFITANRIPSWPCLPCIYDMLVDCGDAIYRVQVKTGHQLTPTTAKFRARLTKRNERKGDQPVHVDALDFVCVVCGPNCVYVIPTTALRGRENPEILVPQVEIGVESRLIGYKNAFAIGKGYGNGADTGAREVVQISRPWYPEQKKYLTRALARRQRVSLDDIAKLRQTLGSHPSSAQIEQAALSLDVTTVTIRNYLKGKRSDLR